MSRAVRTDRAGRWRDAGGRFAVPPPEAMPGFAPPPPPRRALHEYCVTVFAAPRAPWRPNREAAMADAIRLGLASWDEGAREYFLAVPVTITRRPLAGAVAGGA